jgi:hypothetical protein
MANQARRIHLGRRIDDRADRAAVSEIRRRNPPWLSVILSGAEIAGASSAPAASRSTIEAASDNANL